MFEQKISTIVNADTILHEYCAVTPNFQTVGDYIASIIGSKYDLSEMFRFIDTKYDRNSIVDKDTAASLYYTAIDEACLERVNEAVRSDYRLYPKLTNHFIARVLTRFKNNPSDYIFNSVYYLSNSVKKIRTPKERIAIRGDLITLTYDTVNTSLISICYTSALSDIIRKKRKNKFAWHKGAIRI